MRQGNNKTLLLRPIVTFFLCLLATLSLCSFLLPPAHAVDCTFTGSGNDFLVSSAYPCRFAETVDGVDIGSTATNSSRLLMRPDKTLVIEAGQSIGVGSIVLEGGSITVQDTSSIGIGTPIRFKDADGDGYPALASGTSNTPDSAVQAAATGGYNLRKKDFTNTQIDCDDTNASLNVSCTTAVNLFSDGLSGEWERITSASGQLSINSVDPWAMFTSSVFDMKKGMSAAAQFSWIATGSASRDYSSATFAQNAGELPADATSVVAVWNLNETSNTTAAAEGSCGSSCNGTLTGFGTSNNCLDSQDDPTAGCSMSGWTANNKRWGAGALMFDGSNDYVAAGTSGGITGNITFTAWINPAIVSGGYVLVSKRNSAGTTLNYQFGISAGELQICGAAGGGCYTSSGASIAIGEWANVAVTYDGTNIRYYKNGDLITTTQQALTFTSNSEALNIGSYAGGAGSFYKGIMDAVVLYNRALPAGEVMANYQASLMEFQSRGGADATPDDGTGSWTSWLPSSTGTETQVDSMDTAASWYWDINSTAYGDGSLGSAANFPPKTKANDTVLKMEGTGSAKMTVGVPQSDANTIGLWHMEETSGTGAYIADSSGNGNNGTPGSGATVINGHAGKGRQFDGTSNATVTVGDINALDGVQKFTIDAWIYRTGGTSYDGIVTKGSASVYGFDFVLGGAVSGVDDLFFRVDSASGSYGYTTSNLITTNAWHHIVAAFDGTQTGNGSKMQIWIDGVQQTLTFVGTIPATTKSDATNVTIGGYVYNANYFTGIIDEVKISSVATSGYADTTVNEMYRMGREHRLSRAVTSADLETSTKFPLWVSADQTGTDMYLTWGESAYANYEPDSNTVTLLHLEEKWPDPSMGSGNCSGCQLDHTGTYSVNTYLTSQADGKLGKGRSLTGAYTNYLTILDAAALSPANKTVDAWVKFTALGTDDIIMGKASEYELLYNATGWGCTANVFAFSQFASSTWTCANGITTPVTGQWYHVVGTYDGTNLKIYVNGVLEGSAAKGASSDSAYAFDVGGWSGGTATYNYTINGVIDEARLSNIARTAAEVRQAFEVGGRTHTIIVDFKADLVAGALIADSSDTSFSIDETGYGAAQKASDLFPGDMIIVRENVNGTEYKAQAVVSAVNKSLGTVTTQAWDANSTFPTGGYTVNATVQKWQREWVDLRGAISNSRDATTRLTLRVPTLTKGLNIWLDDIESGRYKTTSPATIPSGLTGKQYLQIRGFLSTFDIGASSSLSSISTVSAYPTISPTPIPVP